MSAPQRASVIFQCPLQDSGIFTVRAKNGLLGFGESDTFKAIKVSRPTDPEGDARTYILEGASVIDGVPHNIALVIGTDNNPDSVQTDGDTLTCASKATVDLVTLDTLAGL